MLKEGQVTLRALKKSDAKLLYKWRNELTYIKYTKSLRLPKHEDLEEEWLSNLMLDKSDHTLMLMIDIEDTTIGFVQLTQIDWISKNCYSGIALCESDYEGKGYAKTALSLLYDYAFKHLNLHKVSVEITDFNERSISLYESLGFKKEGIQKEQYFWDDKYHDVMLYGLLKEDLKV